MAVVKVRQGTGVEMPPEGSRRRAPGIWVKWGMRVLLGGAFLFAGYVKVRDPGLFAMDIRSFELIGDPWVALAAVTLPWMELVAGAGVATGWRGIYRGGLVVLGGSLLVFVGALAISWMRGLEITCGCFGPGGETTNYPVAILRNMVLLGLAGVLWRWK